MKSTIRNCLFLLAFLVSCTDSSIYVSTDGDDQNAGTRAKPVASLERAIGLSKSSQIKKINIVEGQYFNVNATLTEADSGLTISGEPGRKVILYGGKQLNNWKSEGEWFVAEVPGTKDRSWDFRIMVVNDSC